MLIGLSVNHKDETSCVNNAYVNAVIKAGGSPVLIPLTSDQKVLDEILSSIDGLLLTGGGDIYAPLFGEELHPAVTSYDLERDHYDIYLVRSAIRRQIPVLGICRGHQVLNVALGGTICQDIPSLIPDSKINHDQTEAKSIGTHSVAVRSDSRLHQIVAQNQLHVNSIHHQSVGVLAPGLEAVAFSEDGVIEAIESNEEKSVLGVQWHPEHMVEGSEAMQGLFQDLTQDASLFAKAKSIHQRIFTIDSHTDTPMYFSYGIDIGIENPTILLNLPKMGVTNEGKQAKYNIKVDIPKMRDGLLDAVFMVAYIQQGKRNEAGLKKAVSQTESLLRQIKKQIEKNSDKVALACSEEDLAKNKAAGKKSIFLGIENGYGIGKDLSNLEKFKNEGVSYITLSHNGDNDICDSAIGKNEHKGLSEFGKEVIREMNRLGLMIDLSHTSEKTSFDVLKLSSKPVIFSHSSAKALCDHPRNVSDKLMKALAENRGVIQICLYPGFIKKGGNASLKDAVDHIDHIVKTIGIDYVGIGSDFDGGGGLKGLQAVNEYPQLTMELLRRGYSEEDIAKIWGGNLLRVLKELKIKN